MPHYYPIMLDIRGRNALVIGGNRIAAEKAASLHASGAMVTVLNPDFCQSLLEMEQRGEVTLLSKTYTPGDLAGAFIVVAATNEAPLIEAIWQETQERNQLVNIVDVPARCNFIMPSILRRDQLTIAVSTEGASPGLAKRIRQQLEPLFPAAYGRYIRLAACVRAYLRQHQIPYGQRDDFFAEFFSSDILKHLIEGNEAQAVEQAASLLAHYQITVPAQTLSSTFRQGAERA
jgi:precorrin-2 dehydrogenase/sirohydrochlorin ferrochelatase